MGLASLFVKFLLVAVLHHADSQTTGRFLVDVASYIDDLGSAEPRCSGAVISDRHILAPASCAIVPHPWRLAIQVVTRVEQGSSIANFWVLRVFIHPNYRQIRERDYNVAVVQSLILLNPPQFMPRRLGELIPGTDCRIFGWGGSEPVPRHDDVFIRDSSQCDPDSPNAFCTQFSTNPHATCDADLGSPVVCGGDGEVAGFAITDGCENVGVGAWMFFHSVVNFREWILNVTRNDFVDDSSALFVVHVVSYVTSIDASTTVRCSGTVISDRHVLSPASCVDVPEPQRIGIVHALINGFRASETDQVIIHPRYVRGTIGINNVAVIRLWDHLFNPIRVPPRSLGALRTNSTCYLHGWSGPATNFRRDPIAVFAPQYCYGSLPQAFCATFDSVNHGTCTARLGSPVICGHEGRVDGFMITESFNCGQVWGRTMQSYHSVEEFRDWIEEVTKANAKINKSHLLVVLALAIISKVSL